jgi:hypothetical protein
MTTTAKNSTHSDAWIWTEVKKSDAILAMEVHSFHDAVRRPYGRDHRIILLDKDRTIVPTWDPRRDTAVLCRQDANRRPAVR